MQYIKTILLIFSGLALATSASGQELTDFSISFNCVYAPPNGAAIVKNIYVPKSRTYGFEVAEYEASGGNIGKYNTKVGSSVFEVINDEVLVTRGRRAYSIGSVPGLTEYCAQNPKGIDDRFMSRDLEFIPSAQVSLGESAKRCRIVDGILVGFLGEKLLSRHSSDYGDVRYFFGIRQKLKFADLNGNSLGTITQTTESRSFYNSREDCNKARANF